MIKSYLIIILFIFYTSCVKAADHGNGFGPEIFTEPPVIKNESIIEETDENIVEESDEGPVYNEKNFLVGTAFR